MDVCYNNLRKLLIDKGMKKSEFAKEAGISSPILAKMGRNQLVSMEVIVKICRFLNCSVDDVLEIVKKTKV